MSLIEKVDVVLSMSGPSITEGGIMGAIREMFAERPNRDDLRQALCEHPGVVTEGLTFRMDPVRHADWLAARFGL